MLARVVVLLSLALGAMAGAEKCTSQCKALTSLIPGCDINDPGTCSPSDLKCTKDDISPLMGCYNCLVKEGVLTQSVADMAQEGLDSFCDGSSGSTGAAAADASGSTATGSGAAAAAAAAPSGSPSAAAAKEGSGAAAAAPIAAGAVVLAGAAMFL